MFEQDGNNPALPSAKHYSRPGKNTTSSQNAILEGGVKKGLRPQDWSKWQGVLSSPTQWDKEPQIWCFSTPPSNRRHPGGLFLLYIEQEFL